MATDYYPDEEYYIGDGLTVGIAECESAITLGQQVKLNSTNVGTVAVAAGAAPGDSVGICLKAGDTGDMVPVVLYGICKLKCLEVLACGDVVYSDTAAMYVSPIDTLTAGQLILYRGLNYTGTICRLGLALQGGGTDDEILVAVGRLI